MVKIVLDSGVLDVRPDVNFPLTFSVGEIRDITKKTGTFSKTLVLPGTDNNVVVGAVAHRHVGLGDIRHLEQQPGELLVQFFCFIFQCLYLDAQGAPTGQPIGDGEVFFEGECIAALVSTIPYWGFGVKVFPFAEARPPDQFCLRIVATDPLHIAAHMRSVWKGTYRHEGLLDFYADDVELQFDEKTAIEIGGDPAGMTQSMRAHLHPDPIKLIDYARL